MLDDILGGLIGGAIGFTFRAAHLRRKQTAAEAGRDVRVRARAHPANAPDWRYWRGALVRRDGQVRWRPLLRRWRSFDLDGVTVVGTRVRRSAWDGDLTLIRLDPVRLCDHLSVSADRVRIAEALLSRRVPPARGG